MCGICGIWGETGSGNVQAMIAAMRHRGPDDHGLFRDDVIAMGMSRLAIIDTSTSGHQPMANDQQTIWIVYNGEMYNFADEREQLRRRGHLFRSASDTEVVLKMYEHYGDEFMTRMRGMFALAIYDKRGGAGREKLLLARDQMGIKPLLYAQSGEKLIFASEIKTILASGSVKPEFDPEAIRLLLTFGSITQPATIVSGVRMLLPGHRLIIEGRSTRIEPYWRLRENRHEDLRNLPYAEQVERLRLLLEEDIRLQMVSDVPIGAFLSGGVDSSLLVALMSKVSGRKVKTFSVGFEQEGMQIDESEDAEKIARFVGTDHSRVMVSGRDVRDRILHIAAALDQPSVDGVNSYFVSMAARKAVTVAISGTGGDELFAGYPWFNEMVLYSNRQGIFSAAKKKAAKIAQAGVFNKALLGRYGNSIEKLRSGAGFLQHYARQYQIFGVLGAAKMLSSEMRSRVLAGREPAFDIAGADELPQAGPIERVTALCLRGYTQNQLLRDIDTVSMAHSLEVRVPFIDPVIADFALSLPSTTKLGDVSRIGQPHTSTYREMGTKKILIDVGRGLLPDDMDLQVKRGFGMPFGVWLQGPLREVLDDALATDSVNKRGLFDAQEVAAVKAAFIAGETSWAFPWLLMMIELWCREVLDKSPVRQ